MVPAPEEMSQSGTGLRKEVNRLEVNVEAEAAGFANYLGTG